VVAGSRLLVCDKNNNIEDLKAEVMEELAVVMNKFSKSSQGVYVQASTLGSLEALLEFLKESDIPVQGVAIGPVKKKDIMKAAAMKHTSANAYAVILAFDVKMSTNARSFALNQGVTIFEANIIYHLFDQFKSYIKSRGIKSGGTGQVSPCVLNILPEYDFKTGNPLIITVLVHGELALGTRLCVPQKKFLEIGEVTAIKRLADGVPVIIAGGNEEVQIKVEQHVRDGERINMIGRDFDFGDQLYSRIESLNQLSQKFREDDSPFMKAFRKVFGFKDIQRRT